MRAIIGAWVGGAPALSCNTSGPGPSHAKGLVAVDRLLLTVVARRPSSQSISVGVSCQRKGRVVAIAALMY